MVAEGSKFHILVKGRILSLRESSVGTTLLFGAKQMCAIASKSGGRAKEYGVVDLVTSE